MIATILLFTLEHQLVSQPKATQPKRCDCSKSAQIEHTVGIIIIIIIIISYIIIFFCWSLEM